MDERDFLIFQFKMGLGEISQITTSARFYMAFSHVGGNEGLSGLCGLWDFMYIYIWIRTSNYLMIRIYCLLHNLLILMIYCLFYRYNVFYRSWFLLSRCVRVCLARWQPIVFFIFQFFTFSDSFSLMNIILFLFKIHSTWFLMILLTINRYWFR